MATTKIDTIGTVYDLEFHTALAERVTQNISVINAGARGTILIAPGEHRGDYKKQTFFQFQQLINRRVDTSISAGAVSPMPNLEQVAVKVKRRAQMEITHDSLRNVEADLALASRVFGERVAEQKVQDMLNTGLLACESALAGVSAVNLDITGETTKTASPAALNRTLAKFGDAAGRVRAFAMHSKPDFDVRGSILAQNTTGITDVVTINGGIPAYLGRVALVTDAPALTDANGSLADTYNTLGLTEAAIMLEESDREVFAYELVTGLENLVHRFQVEYSYTIGIKGFTWGPASPTRNPDNTAIGAAGNWDKIVTSDKDLAGVRLLTQ
jgi:hypothetical protein